MAFSSFEIIEISESATKNRGGQLYNIFREAWKQAVPLTEKLYNELYDI